MMMVMSLRKPSKAASIGMMPTAMPMTRAARAIRSYRKRPQTKPAMVSPTSPKASPCCSVTRVSQPRRLECRRG